MKRILWAVILLAALSVAAAADTIKLTGVGGASQGGVYVAPYYLSINGGAAVMVMCDDFTHHVSIGQIWSGHVSTFADLSTTRNGASALLQYQQVAWLYAQFQTHASQAGDINFAAWAIFTPSVIGGSGWTAGAANWRNLALAGDYSHFNAAGFYVVTPNDLGPGGPQEFVGRTPEPAALVLFGTGLIGIARLRRRL